MARIEGPKYTGTLLFDLTDVKDDLVDLEPVALKGARGEQAGIEDVLNELEHSVPAYGDEAEIHPAVYGRVVSATASIKKLRNKMMQMEKGLEVCRESLGRLLNNREDDISEIATKAEDKSKRGKKPEFLAHFEKSIKYKSQIAEKGAETRRKNEEAAAAVKATKE